MPPRLLRLFAVASLVLLSPPVGPLLAQSVPATASSTSAAPATTSSPNPDDAVVLSPFQVNAGSEQGYLATQTLSGARLKTDLKDIGSALTVFTERQSSSRTASIGACS